MDLSLLTNTASSLAIEYYGIDSQCIVAIEELSELQKELSKHLRGDGNKDHLAEEIADVLIMLEQLIAIFDCKLEVMEWKEKKLKRLLVRVGMDE